MHKKFSSSCARQKTFNNEIFTNYGINYSIVFKLSNSIGIIFSNSLVPSCLILPAEKREGLVSKKKEAM